MRIVLDLQGAQSESRVRGIGRYSLALALAIARNPRDHEVLVALNGRLSGGIEPIRAAFERLLPESHIRVWRAPGPVADVRPGTAPAREAAERIREAFLASLEPDVVHVSSLFEGFGDDAVTSIGVLASLTTAVTLYDLIPLAVPHPHPTYREHYERKLQSFRRADLWLGISQHSCDEAIRALDLPAGRVTNVSCAADPRFAPRDVSPFRRQALMEAFGISRSFVCTVGAPEARKNMDALFAAFAGLERRLRSRHQLVLVGHVQDADREALYARAAACGVEASELIVTGHVSDRDLVLLYNTCAVFVFPSLFEGFGLPALEAMQSGAPVIASNTSSLPEVMGRPEAMFDPRSTLVQTALLTRVLTDDAFRGVLVDDGLRQARRFSWDATAARALDAMERCHAARPRTAAARVSHAALIRAVAGVLAGTADSEKIVRAAAVAIARNEAHVRGRQLFVDISELAQRDAGTGVQRVTRSVLTELLRTPPEGFAVQPVYATEKGTYRYAGRFGQVDPGLPNARQADAPIEYQAGDVFFGLDLQHHVVIAQERFYQELRASGVHVYFMVYDLLPITLPEHFLLGASDIHEEWLRVLAGCDGVIGISRDVADQCLRWLKTCGVHRERPLRIGWSHCGSDVASSLPTSGVPEEADNVLRRLGESPSFLMVGTIEPRKGHLQTLAAFDLLWNAGLDVTLVVVGRRGWMARATAERLTTHALRGRRLFWLESVSDEFLERLYATCRCLLLPSEGEGYGLPLVEASRHDLPILARDLAVFREVAGNHASYFSGLTPESLAAAIEGWLTLYASGEHPRSQGIEAPTWRESVQRLKEIMLGGAWYASWPEPDDPRPLAPGPWREPVASS